MGPVPFFGYVFRETASELLGSGANWYIDTTPWIGVLPRFKDATIMNISLLTVPLKHKRDLLRARHHVRQAADLLGYSAQDQTCLVAAAFDLAYQALGPTGRAKLQLDIVDDC